VIRGLVIGVLIALTMMSCVVRQIMGGPRLTGTCDGACGHYVSCKSGADIEDKRRCDAECPDVFSDRDSLMAYESLSCHDAVEYVDGSQKRTASKPAPVAQPASIKR
jgi:hypothetical protein